MTPLSRRDGPLYRQVEARLRGAILAGELPAGAELPTEPALASRFGVSLITVRQALRELQSAGLVAKRAAKPAVVAPAPRRIDTIADIIAATAGARLEIHSYAPDHDPAAAAALGLPGGAALPCLQAVLLRAEGPLAAITIHFPPAIGERLQREHFDDVVVFRSVERVLGIALSGAQVTVSACVADAALAGRLGIEAGAAVLVSEYVYRDREGRPVERTVARHRADAYALRYELRG